MPEPTSIVRIDPLALEVKRILPAAQESAIERYQAVGLSRTEIIGAAQLAVSYGRPLESVIRFVRQGMTLERLGECLEYHRDLTEENLSVRKIREYLDLINFQTACAEDLVATVVEIWRILSYRFNSRFPSQWLFYIIDEIFAGDIVRLYNYWNEDETITLKLLLGQITVQQYAQRQMHQLEKLGELDNEGGYDGNRRSIWNRTGQTIGWCRR